MSGVGRVHHDHADDAGQRERKHGQSPCILDVGADPTAQDDKAELGSACGHLNQENVEAFVAETLDHKRAEGSKPAVGEVDAENVEEEEPGFRVLERFDHLMDLIFVVDDASLVIKDTVDGDRFLVFGEPESVGWVIGEQDKHDDSPEGRHCAEDEEQVSPGCEGPAKMANAVRGDATDDACDGVATEPYPMA